MLNNLTDLLSTFNITPNSMDNYMLAFTHGSYNIDANTVHEDYERLEFMGDAVLNFIIAEIIFTRFPHMGQGELSRLRAHIVQGKSLAKKAYEHKFYIYIRAGKSIKGQVKTSSKLLEDVLEAFIGAVYFDQGIDFVFKLIKEMFLDDIINFKMENLTDYKSQLQEAMQAEKRSVQYELIEESGLPQDKEFKVRVIFNDGNKGIILGYGVGKNKKTAEQNAAKDALEKKVE